MKANKERIELAKDLFKKTISILEKAGVDEFAELRKSEMKQVFDLFYADQSTGCPILSDTSRYYTPIPLEIEDKFQKEISFHFNFVDLYDQNHVVGAEIWADCDGKWSEDITIDVLKKAIATLDAFTIARGEDLL